MVAKLFALAKQVIHPTFPALRRLNARDELSITNIRMENWHFFAAFPLAMLFLNLEYKFFSGEVQVLGMHAATLYPLMFCAGSLLILFIGEKRFMPCSHLAALVMVVGFCIRLLPVQPLAVAGVMMGWLGLGASGVSAWLMFSIRLNNAERLLGVLSMVFSVNALTLVFTMLPGSEVLGTWLTWLVGIGLAICIFRFKTDDVYPVDVAMPATRRRGNYWILLYAVLYFIILQFANEYVNATPEFSDSLHALGGLAAVVVSIIVQFMCKRSAWNMLNILFLAAAVAAAFYWVPGVAGVHGASFFTGMFSYLGDVTLFYTCGGVMRRHYSMRFFRRFLLAFYGILLISVLAGAGIAMLGELHIRIAITVFVAAAFGLLMMLSPRLYLQLFSDSWLAGFRKLDVHEAEEVAIPKNPLEEMNLTPRENQVAILLLQGMTMRQISAEIGISYHTVNTHCTNLYKKLNVNSKTELFAQYGVFNTGERIS